MKKKLKLDSLKVKSFITEVEKNEVKGGGTIPETMYSCLNYITCDVVKCYVTTQGNVCVETAA